ncbi:hypothetical protein [Helicobacter pylori]|uniref:hypothetical protein n=1 Tax=Helicobacter pylori TaxID=210 RepID=UPI001ABBC9B5
MKIRDKKTWNNLSMGLMGLLKQIPVNLYTKKHNKQIKPIKHGIWLVFFWSGCFGCFSHDQAITQTITQKAVLKNSKTLAIRITKKMITTAPNRLTPNNPE